MKIFPDIFLFTLTDLEATENIANPRFVERLIVGTITHWYKVEIVDAHKLPNPLII